MNSFYFVLLIPMFWFIAVLINHFADNLPTDKKITDPTCISCNNRLSWLSFLHLSTGCGNCKYNFSIRHWIVQMWVTISGVWLFSTQVEPQPWWLTFLILSYLTLVFIIDLEHRYILNSLTIVGLVLAYIFGILHFGSSQSLLGGAVGGLIMFIFYMLGIGFVKIVGKLRGTNLGEDALGFGDVLLSIILGLMVGFPDIVLALFLGVLLGGLFSALYILITVLQKKYKAFTPMPYGPFLIIGASFLIFFKEATLNFLENLFLQ